MRMKPSFSSCHCTTLGIAELSCRSRPPLQAHEKPSAKCSSPGKEPACAQPLHWSLRFIFALTKNLYHA